MNVEHERHRALQELLRGEKLLTTAVAAQLEQPWRSNGIVVQAVFFVLTCVALGAFYGLCNAFGIRPEGVVAGVAAIVLAEYLIGAKRWSGTGVESALWLGGLVCLITELPSKGTPEAILVFVAACAVAGFRVRAPLFGAAAFALLAYYAEERLDLGVVVALVIAALALVALLRTWQRPSTEWLFVMTALLLPPVGRIFADEQWRRTTILLYAVFGVFALLLVIARRHHAFFLAAMIGIAIAATDFARMLAVPAEAKFAITGALLLAIAFAVSRVLHGRTAGFVLTPEKLTPVDDELQLAATFALKPPTPEIETPREGGGAFGGAGASGDF